MSFGLVVFMDFLFCFDFEVFFSLLVDSSLDFFVLALDFDVFSDFGFASGAGLGFGFGFGRSSCFWNVSTELPGVVM